MAPNLRGKNLQVFAAQAHRGIMCGGSHFAYQSPQAYAILQQWFNRIFQRQVSVAEGFRQAAAQVNAFEAAARTEAPAALVARTYAKEAAAGWTRQLQALPNLFPDGGRLP